MDSWTRCSPNQATTHCGINLWRRPLARCTRHDCSSAWTLTPLQAADWSIRVKEFEALTHRAGTPQSVQSKLITLANAKTMALHLAFLELRLVQAIPEEEFMAFLWSENAPPSTTLQIHTLIHWCNVLTSWVAGVCLSGESTEQRVDRICYFVTLAKVDECLVLSATPSHMWRQECWLLHNYDTLMAVVAGLGHSALSRLSELWKVCRSLPSEMRVLLTNLLLQAVPGKAVKTLRQMEAVMDPMQNFSRYRDELRNLRGRLPTIPLFTLYLKDLTFVNEVRKHRPSGTVNFRKLAQVRRKVESFKYFQQSSYSCPPDPALEDGLQQLEACSDAELFNMSYRVQPSQRHSNRLGSQSSTDSFGNALAGAPALGTVEEDA
jgi:hypothetical protein